MTNVYNVLSHPFPTMPYRCHEHGFRRVRAPRGGCKCDSCVTEREKHTALRRVWRRAHPEKEAAVAKRAYNKFKLLTMQHYSNGTLVCVCCSEHVYEFLTLDHINNDGQKERGELWRGNYYRRLVRQGFPEGLQVLCFNCNLGKRDNSSCPHKRTNSDALDDQMRNNVLEAMARLEQIE